MANLTDIYTIVNAVAEQTLGSGAVAVVDTATLIDLGNSVLSSSADTDTFFQTLVQRIGKTIFASRPYNSQLASVIRRDSVQWGQIVQKISMNLIDAQTDGSIKLTDGESVDMYKVSKPKVKQSLFKQSSTYELPITYQQQWLTQAFQSMDAMGSLINLIGQTIADSQTLAEENLAMLAIGNMCAELDGTTRQINVLEQYNAIKSASLTVDNALYDCDFLTYVSGVIDLYSKNLTKMTKYFNDGSIQRHTPKNMQTLFISNLLDTNMRTMGYANTYNAEYMKLPNYTVMTYWQGIQSPDKIVIKRKSDKAEKTIEHQLALISDYDAIGTYRHNLRTYVTPFNARGEYYNQFTKAEDMFFNDLSENAISLIMA